jgi:sugar transferase (PEP-CTERM/EpsH1 system associated)
MSQTTPSSRPMQELIPMNPKIHIVHYVWGFHTGGMENGVVNLINNLPADSYRHSIICQKGYDPAFFARIQHPAVAIYDIHKKEGIDLRLFWRLATLLWRLKPDVFHTRSLGTMEGHLIATLLGIPLRVHGEHGWDVSDFGGTNVKYQKLRRLLKRFVHRFVALSSEAEQYLLDKIGVDTSRLQRICNGVDLSRFEGFEKTEQDRATFVFGTVGRMAVVKNQPLLLEAFIQLLQRCPVQAPQLRLLLVGDGVLREEMEQRALSAGVAAQVEFTGNSEQVPLMLQRMHVFVLPSIAEGISNSILEAMASGLPVIASRVGGNPELLLPAHHQTHLFTSQNVDQLTECMAYYLNHPEKYASDSLAVKKHCQNNFSLATMVGHYHRLYQSVRKKGTS